MDMNRLTQKSQEALARRADHRPALRSHRGRRRASAAGAARPARRAGTAARSAGDDRTRCAPTWSATCRAARGSPARAPRPARSSSPSAWPGILDAAEREAKRLKDEYVSVEHLVLALADEGSATAAGRRLKRARRHPGGVPGRADPDPRQPAGHLGHARRRPTRRWRSTAATWSPTPGPAGSTRSSAATPRSAG